MTLSVVLALVCTGLIAGFWGWTLSATKKPAVQNNAPSPFSALGASIKSTVKNADWKPNSNTQTQTEIIDASQTPDPSTAHDETNPYQKNQ